MRFANKMGCLARSVLPPRLTPAASRASATRAEGGDSWSSALPACVGAFLAPSKKHSMRVALLVLSALYASAFVPLAPQHCATCHSCAETASRVRCRIIQQDQPRAPVLSGGQRRALRTHAGRLAAAKTLHYVQVADVARSRAEVDVQLSSNELVRCKFAVMKKAEAKVMAAELAELTGAAVAEVLGHTALLYRPSAKRLIPLD